MKFFRNAMIAIVIIVVLSMCSFCGFYYYAISPVSKDTKTIVVEIPLGTSRETIFNMLKEKGLIRNTNILKLYLKLNNIKTLQAGNYELNKSMAIAKIVDKLQDGKVMQEVKMITIKEGKTIKYISAVINDKTDFTSADFLQLMKNETYIKELMTKYWFLTDDILDTKVFYPLEGYLFPETYDVYGLTLKEIVELWLDTTNKKLEPYKTKINESKYSIHELMTMASMAELEGKTAESRKKITDVFYNRIKQDMSLGSDVTTYYAVGKSMTEELTAADLKSNSPYNTRNANLLGLPIGPICNPGITSIDAALNPVAGDYLYFVADKNGVVYLTKTYSEHNAIIAKLKKDGLWYTYE